MVKDESLYARAMEEYDSGLIDENLRIKAHVLSNGDAALEKFEYVRLRVDKLKEQSHRPLSTRIANGAAAAGKAIRAERASKAAEEKE